MSGLIFWGVVMLGLVVATIVVAMKESSARKKALAKMQPQGLGVDMEPGSDPMAMDDGFGEADGSAGFDENEFK
ncbi:MAG: hypothetical protein AB8B50_05340 [Pirellulaceae bacterium]